MKHVKVKETKGLQKDAIVAFPQISSFPRTFRWTMESNLHPEIKTWFKRLKTDYASKKIEAEVYDEAQGVVFNWLQDILNSVKQELILVHLNATGKSLGILSFSGLKLVSHETEYDYAKNSVLTHKVTISYDKIARKNEEIQ